MIFSLVFSNYFLNPAEFVAQRVSQAHKNLDRGLISISVSTIGAVTSESSKYILAYDRSQGADLSIQRKKPFRIVITKDRIVEFDVATQQYADAPRVEGSISSLLKHSAGVLDELVAGLADPDGVNLWLSGLTTKGKWRFIGSAGVFGAESVEGLSRIAIQIDRSSHLLKQVSIKTDIYGSTWVLNYGSPPKAIEFVPPKSAYKTKSVNPEIAPPAYGSQQARQITEKVFRKYDAPKLLAYQVQTAGETVSVWIDHGKIRQQDSSTDWTFIKGNLTLKNLATKDISTAKMSLTETIDKLATQNTRIEPILRLMTRGINPFRFYLGQGSVVKLTGSVKVKGTSCELLEATSPQGKLGLIVRSSDGFVLSLSILGVKDTVSRQFEEIPQTASSFQIKP